VRIWWLQVYVEPLKKNQQDDSAATKILTKMEMQSIFGNVEQIYQVASDFVRYHHLRDLIYFLFYTTSYRPTFPPSYLPARRVRVVSGSPPPINSTSPPPPPNTTN
jgi:hypothetical protein